MRWNKYLPFAIIYFFLNIVALPFGLTYTALLAPFFYAWILFRRKKELLLPFIAVFLPFVIAHFWIVGVNSKEYVITLLNIMAIYIFGQAFYTWLKLDTEKEKVFKTLLVINIILCLIGIVVYFTPASGIFWIQQNFTGTVKDFRRLKMFTYEASHYALMFTPLFLFYFLQYIFGKNRINTYWLLFMLFVPFILSFSIGVIGCLVAAGFITFLIHFRDLHTKRRIVNGFITTGLILTALFVVLFVFFRDNPIFVRLGNIISGNDTSAMGRTRNAFVLAGKILEENNSYWGIGIGQLKLVGEDLIRVYYLYYDNTPVAIPNAAAETLILFGWVGFIARILIQVSLFYITKVWTNYYRLMLFLFIFLYQFTGSFITNTAEYVIWIMAFTNAFPAFDVK
ncbi:MAG TPA: hypothetical protein VIV35_12695, partial [Chitinophagaceae bacterium]